MTIIPDYWLAFVTETSLVGKDFYIPKHVDESGVGAELRILGEHEILSESQDNPGIAVLKDGFIPVGVCLEGWEDPYFINIHDGADGPLYRISRDGVSEDGYERSEAIAVVLGKYTDIGRFLELDQDEYDDLMEQGWKLLREGEYDCGLAKLQRAVEPCRALRECVHLAIGYLFAGQYQAAGDFCDELNRMEPKRYDTYYKLSGIARWLMGNSKEAADMWRSGIGCGYTDSAGGVTIPLLLYFAAVRHKDTLDVAEAQAVLTRALQQRSATNWPGPIGRFLLGEINQVQLREACKAGDPPDLVERNLQSGFFGAVSDLAGGGDETTFVQMMRKYVRDAAEFEDVDLGCKEWADEYFLAKYESGE